MTTSDRHGLEQDDSIDKDARPDHERPVPDGPTPDLPPVDADPAGSDTGTADTDLAARLTVDPDRDGVKG